MTENAPPQPETPAPAAERPRLLINGEPARPEELCRMLSEAVLLRLRDPQAAPAPLAQTLELPPVPLGGSRPPAGPTASPRPETPPRRPGPSRSPRPLGTLLWGVLLLLGLLLALFLLLRGPSGP